MKLKDTQAQNAFRYSWLTARIYKYIKPFLGRAILSVLVAIPVGMLDGVVALALRPYIDNVVNKNPLVIHGWTCPFDLAAFIPFGIVLFAGVQGILKYINAYLTAWVSQKITMAVKKDLFAKLVSMDTRFFSDNSSGIMLSRFVSDPDSASKGIVEKLKDLFTNGFGALALVCVMLYSSWRLAIVGVVVLFVAIMPVILIRKKIKSVSNKSMVVGGNLTTNFNETYHGNRVMTSYGLQERQKAIFDARLQDSFNLTMSLTKRVGWLSPVMYLIASCGIAFVLWYGTSLILRGAMTMGALTSFVTSLLLLYKPIKSFGNTLTDLQTVFVAMGRVFELFDLEPEITEAPDAIELAEVKDGVQFKDVCFEYVENQPVLKHINLNVKKGETLAVVGNSGGGKTTLVNLLPRFYDISSGSLTIDGIDVRKIKLDSLRSHIGVVFQDNFLFSGTIRENILLGNKNATEEEVKHVVELAHLSEFLKTLPAGLDTEIGERGTSLSGGQRQRIAIARAMIKNSPIVILDEATSALDNQSEEVVQKALDNLMQNKTVFVIAHRLSTIKNADRIAVLNDGELVELGTHNELMSISDGQYKHLYEMQFRAQDVIEA